MVDEQNIVQRRDLELGTQVGKERVIAAGLEPSDRVIVKGIQRAIPGNPVTPEESTPEEAAAAGDDPETPPRGESAGDDENTPPPGDDG